MRIRIHRPVIKSSTPINTTLLAKQQKKQPVNHPKLDAPDPKFNFDLSKIPISSPNRPSTPPPASLNKSVFRQSDRCQALQRKGVSEKDSQEFQTQPEADLIQREEEPAQEEEENQTRITDRENSPQLERAVERNQVWGRRLGWLNRIDEIVILFQQLGILPAGQTPDALSFSYAVREYQSRNPPLDNDGIIGSNTWRQIRSRLVVSRQPSTEGESQERGIPTTPAWITIARAEIGVREIRGERHHPRVIEYHSTTGRFSDDETPWCASFVNWVLQQAGQRGTGSARALSFRNYGRQLERPAYGSIAVFSWGGGRGHVGFVVGRQGNRLLILGGNQGNRVQVSSYNTSQIVAYVVPPGYQVATTAYNLVAPDIEVASGGGVAETR